MSYQLIRVNEYVNDAFDNAEYVEALFLDAAKAFDTVWHSDLVCKVIKLKFPTTYYTQFILSYLCNRTFIVRIVDRHYTCRQINIVVHRDQSWDPGYTKFTFIMARNKNTNCMHILHIHLKAHVFRLENVFNKWRIKGNPNKSRVVFFSKKRLIPSPLDLSGSPVKFGRKANTWVYS